MGNYKEIKLTDREIEILKALKALGLEWLARDKYGTLYAYVDKPERLTATWFDDDYWFIKDNRDVFDFIKWEDDEPTKIDDLLKGV